MFYTQTFNGLTGGGEALDGVEVYDLENNPQGYVDGHMAIGLYSGTLTAYRYDAANDNTASPEAVPGAIVPDDNATGTGAWIAVDIQSQGWGSPVTHTASYEVQTTGWQKTHRMDAAGATSFTFAALGAAQDGQRITLAKSGAGAVTVDAGALHIGTESYGELTCSDSETGYTITLEYNHAESLLMIVSAFGNWQEAA